MCEKKKVKAVRLKRHGESNVKVRLWTIGVNLKIFFKIW